MQLSIAPIVPFVGVTAAPHFSSLITQWMSLGSIRPFAREHPDLGTKLVGVCLPARSTPRGSRWRYLAPATGLEFIHENGVVHGDLKGVRGSAPFDRVLTELGNP